VAFGKSDVKTCRNSIQKVRRRTYLRKGRRFDTRWCWLLAAGWPLAAPEISLILQFSTKSSSNKQHHIPLNKYGLYLDSYLYFVQYN